MTANLRRTTGYSTATFDIRRPALALIAFSAFTLAGCGGGGDDGGGGSIASAASPVAGLWVGVAANGSRLSGVVLDDGRVFMPYDDPEDVIDGLIHGTASATDRSVSAGDLRDYHWSSPRPFTATLNGSHDAQAINSTVVHSTLGTFALQLTRVAGYDAAATMADMQGNWRGDVVQPDAFITPVPATITADGRVTGQLFNGCSYAGQLALRAERKVVLDISLSFQGVACANVPAQSGVAYLDAAKQLLTVATVSADRSTATVARLVRGTVSGQAVGARKVAAAAPSTPALAE